MSAGLLVGSTATLDAIAQSDSPPETPSDGSAATETEDATGTEDATDTEEATGAAGEDQESTLGAGDDNQTTLGTMPAEGTERADAAANLAEPLPRPAGAEDALLREIEGFERALTAYQNEIIQFRGDLERLVNLEYEGRRDNLQDIYDNEIDQLRDEERGLRLDAIARLEEFVRRYPNHPPETPDALFRLAELYFEKESDDFVLADLAYSDQLDLFEMGRIPDPPVEPEKNYASTIVTFQALVSGFPDYRQVDGALYLMGYALSQMQREDEAFAAFRQLVSRFPESGFAQEAWVRIGEQHFEENQYRDAAAAYQRALAYGEGRLYDEALFKLGWSYYLMNEYDQSLSRFRDLVVYYDGQNDSGGALREEALQYIAVTLAEDDWDLDGQRDADAGFARIRNNLSNGEPWQLDVAERLAEIWFENERYPLSIEIYRFVLEGWPDDRLNPQRHERIVAAQSRMGLFDEAFEEQRQISLQYGPGSLWFAAQEDQGNIRAMAYAEDLVRGTLLDSARYYNEQADQFRDRAEALGDRDMDRLALERYRMSAEAYADFLEQYPSDREAYEVRFLYAQALYYSFEFGAAATEYAAVRDSEGETRRRELAAYQVVRSLELLLTQEIDAGRLESRALPTYRSEASAAYDETDDERELDERDDVREVVDPDPLPEPTLMLIEGYDRYVELGLNSEEDPSTQGRFAYLAAKAYFDHHAYDEARERFDAILSNAAYRCQEEAIYAASLLIESYRVSGDYENMEIWGQRIQALDFCEGEMDMALLQEFMDEAETMRVGAIFRSAEDLFQAESYEDASREYVRLVNQNPDSEFAPAALYNGAIGYERLQRYEPAMRLYQRVVDDYPDCEFVNDALFRVAVNSRRFFDFERATNTYLILAERADDEARARTALLSAAELLEFSGRNADSASAYEDYSRRFADDAAAPIALYRAGLMYEADERYEQMRSVWSDFRRSYGDVRSTVEVPIDAMVLDSLRRTAESYDDRGEERQAQQYYEEVLDEIQWRRSSDIDSLFAAGKARFRLAEQDFERWVVIPIEGNLQRQRRIVQELVAGIPPIVDNYNDVIDIGSAEWTMAAYYMVGRVYQAFADKVYAVPPPDFDDPMMEEAYILELEDFASRFEDEAVENWRVAMAVASQTGIVNEWTIAIIRELNRYLGEEFPLFKEERDFIQQEIISPLAMRASDIPIDGTGMDDELDDLDDGLDDGLDDLNDDQPGLEELDELPPAPPRRDSPERRDDGGFEEI